MRSAEQRGRHASTVHWPADHDTIRPNLRTLSPASRRTIMGLIRQLVNLEHPDTEATMPTDEWIAAEELTTTGHYNRETHRFEQ
jgi:hypothetical protein